MATASLAEFRDTFNAFREATGYTKPLTYEEWVQSRPEHKAALLYVQFYNQICSAWLKACTIPEKVDPADGVMTMCQYLMKNVPRFEDEPKRFTQAYVYQVAYNCLYCICHDLKGAQLRLENETSAIVMVDGEEFNKLDTVGSISAEDESMKEELGKEFWNVLKEYGAKGEKVMRYLLSGDVKDLKKLHSRSKQYSVDVLRDIEVTIEEAEEIIYELRMKFLNAPEASLCRDYAESFDCLRKAEPQFT